MNGVQYHPWVMAEEQGALPKDVINILIAVRVVEPRAFASLKIKRSRLFCQANAAADAARERLLCTLKQALGLRPCVGHPMTVPCSQARPTCALQCSSSRSPAVTATRTRSEPSMLSM